MTRKLIFCFDGTGNEPADGRLNDPTYQDQDIGITNVLKLHLLLGGSLKRHPSPAKQMSFYYPGIGTYGSKLKKYWNYLFAPEDGDIQHIINNAKADLLKHYQPGDQLYVIGFSRGAALARRFSALLHQTHQQWQLPDAPQIELLLAFDTVASIASVPNMLDHEDKPDSCILFEDDQIAPNIKQALHLLAIDERRIAFMPTLMRAEERVTELWFAGGHTDVGGGNYYDSLADICLQFASQWLQQHHPQLKHLAAEQVRFGSLAAGPSPVSYSDLQQTPDCLGRFHVQTPTTFVGHWQLNDRLIRVDSADPVIAATPKIHHSVLARMKQLPDYRPANLLQRPGNSLAVVWEDGSTQLFDNINHAINGRKSLF